MESHDNPIVFISYSQDSLSFSDKVLDFSNRLRSEGIDAILDQYEEALLVRRGTIKKQMVAVNPERALA